ncbi:MAG: ComEA family DNA-binding protein [candidate division Zixibacteria bacterium]|nr:ComEA family DNA-binding protein [candidate division Zixibacteria bacterium]
MNRVFAFSSAQLKVLVFLVCTLMVIATVHIIRGFASEDPTVSPMLVATGEIDPGYTPLFMIDINLSPADSMELVPGIGPALASRIVAYRDSAGSFREVPDIVKVPGIGNKTYEKIKPYLKVTPWWN